MANVMPVGPLITAHLFPTLDARLIDLLRSLTPDDWERQTIAPRWKVKDVAAHLLDTQLRRLSFDRDGYTPSPPPAIASDRDLVSFIDRLNAEGVTVYRRLSPAVLIAWMEQTSREAASYYASLDPFAPARFGVSWAGEAVSANWFDVARELTERWHHQQQIRLAVGELQHRAEPVRERRTKPGAIMTPELYHPVLDCFMRALPFHYRSMSAPPGTAIRISCLRRLRRRVASLPRRRLDAGQRAGRARSSPPSPSRRTSRGASSRRASRTKTAREHVRMTGDAALGGHILNMLAIVG